MGLVYLVAFGSLYVQLKGLFGHEGILPFDAYMKLVRGRDPEPWFNLPSLLWFADHVLPGVTPDGASHIVCLLGMISSAVVLMGAALAPFMVVCWVCYMSLFTLGQTFMSFQWDILLMVMTILFPLHFTLYPIRGSVISMIIIIDEVIVPINRKLGSLLYSLRRYGVRKGESWACRSYTDIMI